MGNSKIVYYGETLIDLTGDTVEAAKLLKGVTAHDKKGEKITGTYEAVDPYAIIGVTYPEGSVCTCSNGSVTLTAKDTTGKAMFVIPSAGTWTVTAVSGSDSASKAVSITAEGQVETVELSFALQIVKDGVLVSGMNLDGLLRPARPGILTQKDGYVEYSLEDAYSSGRAYSVKTVMAPYNTLYIDWIPHFGKDGAAVGLASNIGINTEDELKRIFQYSSNATQNNARQTTTLDVSSANSEYYVGFSLFGSAAFTATIRIYNFYLTPGGTV